jgi:hypothetical protein
MRRVKVVTGGVERVLDLRAAGPVRYTWVDGARVVNAEVEPKGDKLTVTVRGDGFAATVADARAVKISSVGRGNRAAGPLVMRAPSIEAARSRQRGGTVIDVTSSPTITCSVSAHLATECPSGIQFVQARSVP